MFATILYTRPLKKTSHYNRYLGFSELASLPEEELYLIHCGIDKCFQKDRYTERNLTHSFRLKHDILKLRLKNKTASAIQSLIDRGIWIKVRNYYSKKRCNTYAFTMKWIDAKREMVGQGKYLDLEYKQDTKQNRQYAESSIVCNTYLKTLKKASISFTEAELFELVEHEYPGANNINRIGPILKQVARLKTRQVKLSNNNRVNRHYGTLSNIPKYIRRHTLIDGQPITEVDIKSSHPYLLLNLCKLIINNNTTQLLYISRKNFRNCGLLQDLRNTEPAITVLEKLLTETPHLDIDALFNDILTGDLYENLRQHLSNKTTRGIIKRAMIGWLYGEKSQDININAAIKVMYPALHYIRKEMKKRRMLKELSRCLQRLESQLMTVIADRLIRANQSILLYPLHDSFCTIPKYKEKVKKEMINTMIEWFGVSAQVTLKIGGKPA